MKMKLAAIALSGSMLMGGTAFALDIDPSFYVGGDLQYNKLKSGSAKEFKGADGKSLLHKKTSPALGLFLGTRLTENFGLELGYSFLKEGKGKFQDGSVHKDASFNTKLRNAFVDALGYLPLGNDIDLIGSIGLGRLSTKINSKLPGNTAFTAAQQQAYSQIISEAQKAAKTKTGIRLGLGAQYKFDSNLGAKLMLRHQKGNKLVKSVNSASVGLFYQF